jgi:hypothetical protein
MKKLFKEKLKRRAPVEQRKKSHDEPVLRLGALDVRSADGTTG